MRIAAHVNAPAIVWHVTVCKNKRSSETLVAVELTFWFNWEVIPVNVCVVVERSVEESNDIVPLSRKQKVRQTDSYIFFSRRRDTR